MTTRPRFVRTLAAAGTAAATLVLAACGSGSSDETDTATDAGSGSFEPVTLEHALGETTIEERPDRVATWGWGSADAAIALGVVPVAIPRTAYAGDQDGMLPWNKEAIEAAGAEPPTMLTEAEEPPYEEFIKADPDVILATYSGLTQEQYDKLSKIAPVVAYPDQPWATPWRDVITTAGEALGKTDEADQVLADIDRAVSKAADAHPEFQGKTIAAVADYGSFYVYRSADPRVQFLEDLGFETAPSVEKLDTEESSFYFTLSYEKVDQLDSDVLLSYADSPQTQKAFMNAASTTTLPQYDAGTIAEATGEELVASVSPPTALSLTWGLDAYVDLLSEAAAEVS
ncbi:iron-siderophore ABC transporter substrate-binding protein [Nocardioides iriomotensis]|uniref:Iron-siderophore ABC transporter substrate-binding protein n=1 Tax=Nocardioides iriomotensis TaxID=715784 RepID=A0A4Q5IU27_9ACTN|nr:iron-siderophore ABC transporter substrate-binding protein [Nocardioides iriomotensis]RYU09330.1 iron-siderophore ABC transporter substrate-binding protein [Nocardioides iriomotensis]